jgi:PAS domain S-box-containing protein
VAIVAWMVAYVLMGGHQPLLIAAGVALAVLVGVREALASRRARFVESVRRKTEARLGWLLRNSSDLVMAVDRSGNLDYVSPSVERLLRKESVELVGTSITDLVHPEDAPGLSALLSRALAAPGGSFTGEWRIQQEDGGWLPVETVATCSTRGISRSARCSSGS